MTSRGLGRASRSPEMEEKEQLRRQIRLLQGLIDDYKTLHGSAPAQGISAPSRWQPPACHRGRAFDAQSAGHARRGFAPHHGSMWRKKYSLVNKPPGHTEVLDSQNAQPAQGRHPQACGLERQVHLSPDQNMVVKIKPSAKPGSASPSGPPSSPSEVCQAASWTDQGPQEGEGEPPGGRRQPSKPGQVRGRCRGADPLLVCQKEPGRARAVKSGSAVNGSTSEPRRTVSEGALATKARGLPTTPERRKLALNSAVSCGTQPLGTRRVEGGRPDQPDPATPGPRPRPAREASLPVSCRAKFRKSNYKWVAASAKSPRATRRALSPRGASENLGRGSSLAERAGRLQLRLGLDAKARKPAPQPRPAAASSKYKWKASSASCSSFHWQPEASARDRAALLSPVLSQSPPEDSLTAGCSGTKPLFGETSLSGYKVKSRTKIIRRRPSAGLTGDKKTSSPATTVKSPFSLRRRQSPRGKGSPVLKKTPNKGLLQVSRHRLCRLPLGRTHLPTKDASSLYALRTSPSSKVIKTRYRIVKKTPPPPLGATPFHQAPPTWRTRRLPLHRPVVLNRLRSVATGTEKASPSPPLWRNKGYRCIGGVLYRVTANKLSKTSGRLTGRLDPTSCSRSLASRALQRSLATIRQAQQRKKERQPEYCMYYNRFGRCNRGDSCPYIHDPEKVAVCTRFLRGTCKKTDGTCPFSHHISKDKMPVCSYFLKGICSNSNCPYSHVYVSRKAEVCRDFLKGYCPLGTKCKKKHTLLCPDFSRRGVCPRGAQCQLLHRARKRSGRRVPSAPSPSDASPRSRPSSSHTPRKPSAAQRPPRQIAKSPTSTAMVVQASTSQELSGSPPPSSPSSQASLEPKVASVQEPASAPLGSQLPSFISLRCSPSPAPQAAACVPRSPPRKDSGKSLHIKPRL